MLVSINWLKDFVFLPDVLDEKELALQLTMHSVEVEEIKKLDSELEHIVIGRVLAVQKHSNADALNVCSVDVGSETLQIVCGGSNVREGMNVALGKIGARVRWHGEGELVELKKTKIRGETSDGMICASDEIGLEVLYPKSEDSEILDLSHCDAMPGTPLSVALDVSDVVVDIENKTMTHRPDLWGHYGMARELAAIQRKRLEEYKTPKIKEGGKEKLTVRVEDKALCKRYMAVKLEGVRIEPSPLWMQKRLRAVGVRPINNVVDITNYVMLELGQPMHAFDAAHIVDNEIIVRTAKDGERFQALGGAEYMLDPETLVISNNDKVVAVAGVKGDMRSGVTQATTSIIFESANFDSISVRKSAQRLALRTDSSTRFEKSLDPNMCELALRRAVELMRIICPGSKVVSNVADSAHFKLDQGPIVCSFAFLNKKIGATIEKKRVIDILERLGFKVDTKKDNLYVTVPTWRATKDVSIAEDIVEEVARMYGYGTIETTLPTFAIAPPPESSLRKVIESVQKTSAHECGFNELLTYAFVSPELLQKLGEKIEDYIELDNPVAKDRPFLRRHLMPGLLEHAEQNLHRFDEVSLFEVGRVFRADESGERIHKGASELLPEQDTYFGAVHAAKGEGVPFYVVSGLLKNILMRLHVEYSIEQMETEANGFAHPGRFAMIKVADQEIGKIGELHPRLQQSMGIAERVGMLELNLSTLAKVYGGAVAYVPVPQYPTIVRDVAFVVARGIEHTQIKTTLLAVDELIRNVEVFDVYEGTGVSEGHKSMAYHITYRSDERTLENEEVDKIQKQVVSLLKKQFDADIRS